MISYTVALNENDICTDITWDKYTDLMEWRDHEPCQKVFSFEWNGITAESITNIKEI